jgi:hypothetical protein
MGRYTAEANTTLHLDDGQVVTPGEVFETEFRPEQEAHLLACGAMTKAEPEYALPVDVVSDVPTVLADVQPAGEPGVKE